MAGINYTSYTLKIASLIFNSSGMVSYIPAKMDDIFFMLFRNKPLLKSVSPIIVKDVLTLKPHSVISEIPHMLLQQKKNSAINHVELRPLRGVQYTRSFGSKSAIIKLDTRTGLSLLRLSSGVKKVFSAFSLSSKGNSNLYILKNRFRNTKSGD